MQLGGDEHYGWDRRQTARLNAVLAGSRHDPEYGLAAVTGAGRGAGGTACDRSAPGMGPSEASRGPLVVASRMTRPDEIVRPVSGPDWDTG